MKLLSILRLAKHQRFHIEPRYYDEVKEDLKQRTSRINREVMLERRQGIAGSVDHARLRGTFSKNKLRENSMTGVIRMFFVFIITAQFVGFYYYGNIIFCTLLLAIPVYYWFRWKK